MSRPRKPFGATHPGRLPATMMKVLAAEMSDPHRLRRGKQYAHDGSVTDIIVEPGIVTCEVQGSRSTPYIVQLEVSAGDGMPMRRDVSARCSCPDDGNFANDACKHVVAAMFTLSNELLLEPELLDVWRRRDPAVTSHGAGPATAGDDTSGDDTSDEDTAGTPRPLTTRGHLTLVHSDRGSSQGTPARGTRRFGDDRDRYDDDDDDDDGADDDTGPMLRAARPDPEPVDRLAHLIGVPDGAELPEIPELEPVQLPVPRRHELAQALTDALRHVRVDWD
jgi:hypothetical protein